MAVTTPSTAKAKTKRWGKTEDARLLSLIIDGTLNSANRSKNYIALIHNKFFSEFKLDNFTKLWKKKSLKYENDLLLSGSRKKDLEASTKRE